MVKKFYVLVIAGLVVSLLSSCMGDCNDYLNFYKKLEVNGRITYLWFNGRNMDLKFKDLTTGEIKSYEGGSTYAIYNNAEKFSIGDTLVKNKGELFFILKNKRKHLILPIECLF